MPSLRHWPPLVLLFLALAVPGAGRCADVGADLYQAEVPVPGPGPDERPAAIRAALAEVLVRVSGDAAVVDDPGGVEILDRAGALLQQYRYDQVPGDAGPAWRLRARFDPAAVADALRARDLPVWGGERPDMLVWVAAEWRGGRRLVGEEGPMALRDALRDAARRRGLPVLLPLLDATDMRAVAVTDVWGGFMERVMAASARYDVPAVLAGRIARERGGWRGRWTLRLNGEREHWETGGAAPEAALAAAVDRAADLLARRFAVRDAGVRPELAVIVEGVDTPERYALVLRYLTGLNPVRDLQVTALEADRLELALTLSGEAGGLERAVALGSVLRPVPEAGPGHYRVR